MTEAKIYVGLNDATTKTQRFDTGRYVELLKKVCVGNGIPFSFNLMEGGYIHEDGTFTQENSIVVTLIDVDEGVVDAVARDLCMFFHQESVLVTLDRVEVRSISETL